jgi:hypothetical protein
VESRQDPVGRRSRRARDSANSLRVPAPEVGFAKTEHREHVYSIGFLELLIGDFFELVVTALKGGVVHQDIDATESIDRFLGDLFRYRSFADIARDKNRFPAILGNQMFRLLGILVF